MSGSTVPDCDLLSGEPSRQIFAEYQTFLGLMTEQMNELSSFTLTFLQKSHL